ncbi:MAG: DUF2336 domain-containing protein [Rhodospirillaceae bacterium]|nr:DUF2336 domain-containing protein [Rhodospirillaceae bacterium]
MAGHDDENVRLELAARPDVKPEILYFLADEASSKVRTAIAENQRTPHHADIILAKDKDANVRERLADKISRLAPELSPDDKDKVKKMAYDTLETLAKDELTRARQILAEALQDVAGAPAPVIRKLAFDTELVVAGPILENSPVLTDEDLMEIIERGSTTGRLSFISKRKDVTEGVSEAIVATADEYAVALLLANPSARIRETTLDRVVDEAKDVISWHAPLVSRPQISGYAAKRLAGFVAANLIRVLSIRSDLEPDVLEEVKKAVTNRIEGGESDLKDAIQLEDTETPLEVAMGKVQKLKDKGDLNEARVRKMVSGGKKEEVIAALAIMNEVPAVAVQKAINAKNIKGVVSICWKAELSAKTAEQIQSVVVEIGDSEIMKAESGKYAMSDSDMEWQFEFVIDMA